MLPTDPDASKVAEIAGRFQEAMRSYVMEAAPFLASLGIPYEKMPSALLLIATVAHASKSVSKSPRQRSQPKAKKVQAVVAAPVEKHVEPGRPKTLVEAIITVIGHTPTNVTQIVGRLRMLGWEPGSKDVNKHVTQTIYENQGSFRRIKRGVYRVVKMTDEQTTLHKNASRLWTEGPAEEPRGVTKGGSKRLRRASKVGELRTLIMKRPDGYSVDDLVRLLRIGRDPTIKLLSNAKFRGEVEKTSEGIWRGVTAHK